MGASMTIVEALLAYLPRGVVVAPEDIEPRYFGDWTCINASVRPAALVLPRTTEDVAIVMRTCQANRCPVVIQGGRTGLAGGATPADGWVIMSMERMRAVGAPDPVSATICAEAGATLQAVQLAADGAGMLFPLDIGGRGSCTVGGNISTNAGGNRVLRYGMMRELVLGMEVVLVDGTILTSLNTMLKNNTGYDLKHWFIGSEGTLGVVTRAVLRLFPKPTNSQTALCAVQSYTQVIELLNLARVRLGSTLAAYEVMWPTFYELGTTRSARRAPLPIGSAAYILVESMGTDADHDASQFQEFLEEALSAGAIADGILANSVRERQDIWDIRDSSGEFQKTFWPYIGFDVSLPIGVIGNFVEECTRRLQANWPDVQLVIFGHVADSNIHICVRVESAATQPQEAVDEIVYRCVGEFSGSISAEHGIGLLKKRYLSYSRSEQEVALMRCIKRALDPHHCLNPGKIFD